MKFLLDENIPYSLYRYLKSKGHDVTRAQDLKRGLSDTELLQLAKKDDRVLVTLDKDFAQLYLLEPDATIVLINIHPALPKNVVKVFENVLEKKALFESKGLIVASKRWIRKVSL